MVLYIHVTVLHPNRFLFNNQPDALIIQIFFCHKTLHVSGIFSSHHQEVQAESGCSILTLLGSDHQNLHETYQFRMYGRKLLMIGREDARNI
jgi:hypothetical protein